MEIFGIGLTEILFIIVLILIIFGPEDLAKNSRELGQFLNKIITSDAWRAMQKTTSEVKKIPTTLMREANIQAFEEERRKLGQELRTAVSASPISIPTSDLLKSQPPASAGGPENPIAPLADSTTPPTHPDNA